MFRIPKIASFLTRTLSHNQTVYICRETELHHISNAAVLTRFYSKDWQRDKSGKCPPCEESKCKPPKPELPDCKPAKDHPCAPPPCNRLPQYQECPRPNRMDGLPDPICPYEEKDPPRKRKRLILLLIGTAIFLVTCAAVYKIQNKKPPRVPRKKKSRRPQLVRRLPCDPKCIPKEVPYLLIGGGTASFSAFRAIKSADPTAKVLVVSSEGDFPYMRPPLSKEIWYNEDKTAYQNLIFKQWNGSERSLFYEPDDFYVDVEQLMTSENGGIALAKGYSITHIDVCNREAFLDTGDPIKYGKCLIATGASPKNLDIFAHDPDPNIQAKISLYRNIFDFQELYEISEEASNIAVIGGGFLGSELACSLARKGKGSLRVYQIFKEGGNMANILPEYLSYWTMDKVRDEGVEVLPYAEVTNVKYREKNDSLVLTLSNGKTVTANHVVVAVGVEPNTDIAEKSSLEIDSHLGGFVVNTELQARQDLYVAGDCACFYDSKLGRRRVEHHDHAVVSGRLAGENMTGSCKSYVHQAMFWSDLGPDVGYEAIGIVDSSLPTVGVFAKPLPVVGDDDNDNVSTVKPVTTKEAQSTIDEKIPSECKQYIKKDPEQEALAQEIRRNASKAQDGEDFAKGVIFYLRNDVVVGIVLWNLFNRMNVARQVLKDERKYDDLNEVAKLFNIHED